MYSNSEVHRCTWWSKCQEIAYAGLCEDLGRFSASPLGFLSFFRQFERRFAVSRSAPENSLALNNECHLKISIDRIDYALYNIVMKLRNRIQKFKVKHRLYCAKDIWKRYDILITMLSFWVVVITLLALEENGII